MMYFEDFLELIEHLPQETVESLTKMRELDLHVQNSLDNIERHSTNFLQSSCPYLHQNDVMLGHQTIIKGYEAIIDDSEEKIQIAKTMSDTLVKYIKRLDRDILKFKFDLEADNCGITDFIEKRVDNPVDANYLKASIKSTVSENNIPELHQLYPGYQRFKNQDLISVEQNIRHSSLSPSTSFRGFVEYQNNQCDQKSTSQSLSYPRINEATALDRRHDSNSYTPHQYKKKQVQMQENYVGGHTAPMCDNNNEPIFNIEPDPNEPRYCLCDEVAFGYMVACDNDNCPIEWFHYTCVGMIEAPAGKWYCPLCLVAMKKRRKVSH